MDIFFPPLWNILEDTELTPPNRWQLLGWSFSTAIEIWEDALCVVGILGWTIHLLFLHKDVRDARADVYQLTGVVAQLKKTWSNSNLGEKNHNFMYSNQGF